MWTDLDVFICNMGQVNELFWNSGDGTLVHDTGTILSGNEVQVIQEAY